MIYIYTDTQTDFLGLLGPIFFVGCNSHKSKA